ncbi:MAG TPA: hypothetical protein DDZ80_24450 [Cyanobacteria bacterium UBA8803]|nr:hypothetical protein [Cyanobacteria bacterium UBA9273]HBL61462.1 hypothetical protein [Cyanobacteria bacterium UBA8803]
MLKANRYNNKGYLSQFWHDQIKPLLPAIFVVYVPLFILLLILRVQTAIPVPYLTRDPVAIFEAPFYLGAISNLGILFWCSAAAICLFCCVVLKKLDKHKELKSFFLMSGLISSVFLIDDFFLFHDDVFPKRLHFPEEIVVLLEGLMVLAYLVRFRKNILNDNFIFLLFALMFFGFSAGLDQSFYVAYKVDQLLGQDSEYFVEDGLKLLGIVSWFMYLAIISVKNMLLLLMKD